MTEEKKKPEKNELSDKDLENVAGGAMRVENVKTARSLGNLPEEEEDGPVQT